MTFKVGDILECCLPDEALGLFRNVPYRVLKVEGHGVWVSSPAIPQCYSAARFMPAKTEPIMVEQEKQEVDWTKPVMLESKPSVELRVLSTDAMPPYSIVLQNSVGGLYIRDIYGRGKVDFFGSRIVNRPRAKLSMTQVIQLVLRPDGRTFLRFKPESGLLSVGNTIIGETEVTVTEK